jgi:uncharacterized protein (DUF2147 family)
MKKLIFIAFCALQGLCFAADPVEGFWVSVDEKTAEITAGWEVYQENGMLYGKILSVKGFPGDAMADACKESYKGFPVSGKVNEMPLAGTPWIWGLTSKKAGEWSGGSIIDPESGSMYKCKMTFRTADGKKYPTDTLEMRGEIGLGIGRSQFWQKSTREQASSLK